ncbi:MAG: BadF/BadG/BcrA/BcrD ATPase family protein [Bdellovibrionota bacterium]
MNCQTDCFIGIDLGSTTTKAVVMGRGERVLGRGITNSRSNYEVACQVAREEAETSTRFLLLDDRLKKDAKISRSAGKLLSYISCKYALGEHLKQLSALKDECAKVIVEWNRGEEEKALYKGLMSLIFERLASVSEMSFQPGGKAQSDFFRDIATSLFLKEAEAVTKERRLSFDRAVGVFDKAILRVESRSFAAYFADYLGFACEETLKVPEFSGMRGGIASAVKDISGIRFNVVSMVGTGYGRLTLPFPKEQIRSEILCHGLGAHYMFPLTRTVLDIGGQDTKAIQVDANGIVTGFQMNDRCAAGCGRYLGYIADEMNMGVHQLGPLAMQSKKPARINSTCTVFAGAELRERLSLGEKREDIIAGLHRAIILRAMSLIARSGGAFSEFTFTGGVARNQAATAALKELLVENYGEMKMNISSDSIYTGALGASLFAMRAS